MPLNSLRSTAFASLLLASVVSALLIVLPVYASPAMQETATASATYEPYFDTSTPWATMVCPTSTTTTYPTGTSAPYTPVFSTFTPVPSATATITPTAAATLTPTTPPIGIYQDDTIAGGSLHYDLTANQGNITTQDQAITVNPAAYGHVFAYEYVVVISTATGGTPNGSSGHISYGGSNIWQSGGGSISPSVEGTYYWLSIPSYTDASTWANAGLSAATVFGSQSNYNDWLDYYYPEHSINHGNAKVVAPGNAVLAGYRLQVNAPFFQGTKHTVLDFYPIRIWVWGSPPVGTPTPTPEVTPTVQPCGGIFAGYPTPEGGGVGITLPIPVIGSTSCFVMIPAFDVEVPEFAGGDLSFDGFQVCIRAISFGILDFGFMQIDVDVIAIVLGGIALFRWLMRTAT